MQQPTVAELQQWPIFASVDPKAVAVVAAASRGIELQPQEFLFTKQTLATCFYGVVRGSMQLSVSNPDGNTKIVEIIRPHQTMGEAVMFLNRRFPVDAIALEPSHVIQVPAQVIDSLLDTEPKFARDMVASISLRLHSLVRDIEMYTIQNSRQRVINHMIVAMVPNHDRQSGCCEFQPSKRAVASRLGMTPETFSRTLRELADDRLIIIDGATVLIPSVRALSESAAS